jgi:DNA-cytosine methyltransferase
VSELLSLLCNAVATNSRNEAVALLLSGGLDSASVGIALQKTGKTVRAYTYHLEGYASKDLPKAEAVARHFGWPLTVVSVPTNQVAADFVRLAVEQRCRKKVQFEVAFPLLHMFPWIREGEIWSGFNADDHYGNTKNFVLQYARMVGTGVSREDRKKAFDAHRQAAIAKTTDPESGATWQYAQRLAAENGKELMDPYLDPAVRDFFLPFDHEQLSRPAKPIVREALADELHDLPRGSLAVGVRLQIGGGVDSLFETLLKNDQINRFEKQYTTVSALCQRWGREVARDPDRLRAELKTPRPSPVTKVNTGHRPYTMDDVRRASARPLFKVVSMFAGGGGSSVGYRLAGGEVVLASEFVPEAARTYKKNFPTVTVDPRDIREIAAEADGIELFLARAGLKPGELDILDGSPPCCEFSIAGPGLLDQHVLRNYSDVQQRDMGTLIFDFFDVAVIARPRVVVCENVPMLKHRHGGPNHLLARALDALRFPDGPQDRVYYATSRVLNAADFGVPQTRKRLFLIALRRDVAETVGIRSDADVATIFPVPTTLSPVSIRSALAGLQQSKRDIDPWRRVAMTTSLGLAIRRLPRNPIKRTRPSDIDPDDERDFTLTRCAWDLPAPTLTVNGQQPNALGNAIHPAEDRKFTLPELKRLSALPDDFVLTGTLAQAVERVCRMVPPPLTRAIAESLYESVLRRLS